jgi:TolB protein
VIPGTVELTVLRIVPRDDCGVNAAGVGWDTPTAVGLLNHQTGRGTDEMPDHELPHSRSITALLTAAVISLLGAAQANAQQSTEYVLSYMGVGGSAGEVAHVLGFIRPDGTEERYPEFGQPTQKSWVFGPLFADGRRIILTSFENTDVKSVRAGRVVTHDWLYDLVSSDLQPVLEQDRQADQLRPYALLPGEERIVETAYIGNEERIFIKDLDGRNPRELTAAGGGFHYALELSHDGRRLACHVTGGAPAFYNLGMYSINAFDLDTGRRTLIAGQSGHLMFGPRWSPDDKWLAYLDCRAAEDPAHFRADLAVGRADGSEHRVVTRGQTHWFGTPFGSNMTEWSPDGKTITYTRLLENSKPDMSSGGSQLCLLNPETGAITELTPAEEGVWDYRAAWSPEGDRIAFTSARPGAARELWMMNADGSNARRLTDGYQHKGADFTRWLRVDASVTGQQ